MRRSSILLATLSLACALSAAWSWWQLRATRGQVARLEQQVAALQAGRETLSSSVPAVAPPAPTAAPAAIPAAALPAPAPKAEKSRMEEIRESLVASREREREMMRDPAYRKARVDEMRRMKAEERADAIRILGLTAEQADRLADLSAERMVRINELLRFDGEKMSKESAEELERLDEAHKAQLRELLGTEKYERWNRYQLSGMERQQVGQFRAQLSTTAEPLRDNQADAIADSLFTERQRMRREYGEYLRNVGIVDRGDASPDARQRSLDLEKEAYRRVSDTMAATLSRAQLASLNEMLAARLVPKEAALRMQLEGTLPQEQGNPIRMDAN